MKTPLADMLRAQGVENLTHQDQPENFAPPSASEPESSPLPSVDAYSVPPCNPDVLRKRNGDFLASRAHVFKE